MAQSANMELVENLRPFIVKSVNKSNLVLSNLWIDGFVKIGDSVINPLLGQLHINDGGAGGQKPFLALSSSVNHTATNVDPNEAYFSVGKYAPNAGGVRLMGHSTDRPGFSIDGVAAIPDNSTADYSVAQIHLTAWQPSASNSIEAISTGYNMAVFRNGSTTDVIIKAGGAIWSRANAFNGPFDYEDDVHLLRSYSLDKGGAIRSKWDDTVQQGITRLKELGIMEGDFININSMMELQIGALWQLHTRISELEDLGIINTIKLLLSKIFKRKRT